MTKILVSMDDQLVSKLDAEAALRGVSRSELLSGIVGSSLVSRADRVTSRRAIHAAERLKDLGRRAGTPGDATAFIREMRDAR